MIFEQTKNEELELPILEDSFVYPYETVPVYEIDGRYIAPYSILKQVAETVDTDIYHLIELVEESNKVNDLCLLINEPDTLLEDLDPRIQYVVNPISEVDKEYIYVNECVEEYLQTLNEEYLDILEEESVSSKLGYNVNDWFEGEGKDIILKYLQNYEKNLKGRKSANILGFAGIRAKDFDPITSDIIDMVKKGEFDPSKIDKLPDHGKALYSKISNLVKNPSKIVKSATSLGKGIYYGHQAGKQLESDKTIDKVKGTINAGKSILNLHKAAYGKGTLGTLNQMDNDYLHGGAKAGLAVGVAATAYANRKRIAKRIAALRRLYDKHKHSKSIPSKVLWRIKDLIRRLVEKIHSLK